MVLKESIALENNGDSITVENEEEEDFKIINKRRILK